MSVYEAVPDCFKRTMLLDITWIFKSGRDISGSRNPAVPYFWLPRHFKYNFLIHKWKQKTQRPLPVAGYSKECRSFSENYVENKVLEHVCKYKTRVEEKTVQ